MSMAGEWMACSSGGGEDCRGQSGDWAPFLYERLFVVLEHHFEQRTANSEQEQQEEERASRRIWAVHCRSGVDYGILGSMSVGAHRE